MTLADAAAFLSEHGVDEAQANAEIILAAVLKTGRNEAKLRASEPLSDEQTNVFRRYVEERASRRPLAYVLGSQSFMGLDMAVDPRVLIPRPETEELVVEAEKCLRSLNAPKPHILEIGTGSGCIAIALAKSFPSAEVRATDISLEALAVAARNARTHGVERRVRLIQEDLFQPSDLPAGWAHLVVSNPPYIPQDAIEGLDPEVCQEPHEALDGGPDGLDALRVLAQKAQRWLGFDGFFVFEFGAGQGPAVSSMVFFREIRLLKDAQGLERIAVARF